MNNLGQVFTPLTIVKDMLDMVGFTDDYLVCHTVLEPSFGAGVFLKEITQRTLSFCNRENVTKSEIRRILSNLYGIEIDRGYYEETLQELNLLVSAFGIDDMEWNFICEDSLIVKYDFEFDLIIGNPPYVRYREMGRESLDKLNHFQFATGMTDMYILFFELGINCLKNDGKLCYITPNSFFKVKAQEHFRHILAIGNMVEEIVDYGSHKVFEDASVCVAITYLRMNREKPTMYYTKMDWIGTIKYTGEYNLRKGTNSTWDFVTMGDLDFLGSLEEKNHKLGEYCRSHSAIETNANNIYLVNRSDFPESEWEIIHSTVKASTLDTSLFLIFPYCWDDLLGNYKLLEEEVLKHNYPVVYDYLLSNKDRLLSRDLHNMPWYSYARSQGIAYMRQKKLVIKKVIRDSAKSFDILEVGEDTLVYSGVFIVANNDKDYTKVLNVLRSEDFARYVILTGKNKQGGYIEIMPNKIKNFGVD